MIGFLIAGMAAVLLLAVSYAHWVNRRARRDRRYLRHITGIDEWWGKR